LFLSFNLCVLQQSAVVLFCCTSCTTAQHVYTSLKDDQHIVYSGPIYIYIYIYICYFFTVIVCYSNIRNRLLTMLLLYIFTPPAHQHQHSKLCRTNKLSTSTHASRSRDKASARPTCPVTCGQERPAPAPRR
jgi:hypothetical protein